MKARDRRALLVLAVWALLIGGWYATQAFLRHQRAATDQRARREALRIRVQRFQAELDNLRAARGKALSTLDASWARLPEDQLRLRGQDGLLGACERTGLRNARLEPRPDRSEAGWRVLAWGLEAEGTLEQWLEALQALERSQPLMALEHLQLTLPGEAWSPTSGQGPEGPLLRGRVALSWSIPEGGQP